MDEYSIEHQHLNVHVFKLIKELHYATKSYHW